MTVLAYASADSSPVSNPTVDGVIDLSAVSLPQTLQLYAGATDSTDPSATFTYQWYVMSKPGGSSVALSSATISNPVLNSIDAWGNVRLFVVATSSAGDVSDNNPLTAPSSAFTVARVLSANQGIQKPAAGERNWFNDLEIWADKIEAIPAATALPSHTITQHSDVTDATGADLEQLSGGGYATDPDAVTPNPPNAYGRNLLHKHHGGDVDVATAAEPGVVFLPASYSGDPAAPTVVTDDYVLLTASWTGVQNTSVGATAYVVPGQTGSTGQVQPCLWFALPQLTSPQVRIDDIVVLFHSVPKQTSAYQFDLVEAPWDTTVGNGSNVFQCTQIASSNWTMPTNPGTTIGDAFAASKSNGGAALNIGPFPANAAIGFRVTASPAPPDCAVGMSVTLVCRRAL